MVKNVTIAIKGVFLLGWIAVLGSVSFGFAEWRTIHNDFYWSDQNGNRIQTRSGDLRKFGDTYYWYGGTNFFRNQTCYTSKDMINWTYQGVVLSHNTDANRIDVLHNETTGQYVMVMKYDGNGAHLGIATADTPEGPFEFQGQTLLDDALMGDMSVFIDSDGKAYLNAVSWKTGTNAQHGIWLLSPDYLTVERRIFLWNRGGREAPMMFKRNGIYYYGTSATDWTASTSTMYYSATDLEGPWSELTPLSMPGSSNSWDSQCDFVLPIRGSQDSLYMYVGDRWEKPDPRREGDYIWLPVTFDGDKPVINYHQDWDLNLEAGTWRPFDYSRNLALHKTATASSENGSNSAENAIDSSTFMNYIDRRWESSSSDPQWIMVDLGTAIEINRVILKWHENAGRSFTIQVSNDASTWDDVYSTDKGGSRTVTDVTFERTAVRYVRMYGTRRTGRNGYSLFDFMILNDGDATSTANCRPTSASKPSLNWNNFLVSYHLPLASPIKLEVFDFSGKSIGVLVNGYQNAGSHNVVFPATTAAGLYLIRLQEGVNNRVSTRIIGIRK
ncbi:MAG: discoidin domain-containing protein [Chitinispirillaceae bacterium]|nr:discoidin domain-containing protein [Chitinispirillaceae bacterium]